MNFIKLIYFDEGFVADFLQIIAGGELKKTTELIRNSSIDSGIEVTAEANVGGNKNGFPKLLEFLNGVSIGISGKGELNTSYNKDKVVRNILENTLLADFMNILKSDERRKEENKRCNGIHIFDKIDVKPEPNSFTFFILAAPFLGMINGDFPIQNDDGINMRVNINDIGEIINDGRGYYEFIANRDDKDIVLRFNISAFRNNYTMYDLPKMKLTYYAIYVGEINRDKLQIQKEFEFGVNTLNRVDYADLQNSNIDEIKLKVYDVILAGIGE